MLGMTIFMPGICFSRDRHDTLAIERVWEYAAKYQESREGIEQNVYMIYTFNTIRRNPTLWLVPTMYSIAKGDRSYVGEAYFRMKAHDNGHYDFQRQVFCSTIPHNRHVMPSIMQYITPDLYNETLFGDDVLSPFYYSNRFFYKYRITAANPTLSIIRFRPRTDNTQLVKGQAVVETATGRIRTVTLSGNFDMTTYKLTVIMDATNRAIPERSKIDVGFKFLGNHIDVTAQVLYNCSTTLPDSIRDVDSREQMDTLRPVTLNHEQEMVYQLYGERLRTAANDTVKVHKRNKFRDFMWNVLGDNLVNSQHANTGAIDMRMSPLLNPLYLSYSRSRGLSYKLRLGFRFSWNAHRYLTLNPTLGYNFKQRQFYYDAPLRMTYNPKRNGYAEIRWANGNRISNNLLNELIHKKMGDEAALPEFRDEYVQAFNNIEVFDWLELSTGVVLHQRKALHRQQLDELQLPYEYRSFAPMISVKLRPWQQGPVLAANYEHSIKGVFRSNLKYERWELDVAHRQQLKSLRAINYRLGAGFYTHRSTSYFVDYTNFRDDNLPTNLDDDWTGQFQLLKSQWYNASDYYLRGNVSFESPLLALTWIPGIGRLLEMERIYLSMASIEHTRPYFELGYGFTNRYFSVGLFTSYLNTRFQDFGMRFTIELFRRW